MSDESEIEASQRLSREYAGLQLIDGRPADVVRLIRMAYEHGYNERGYQLNARSRPAPSEGLTTGVVHVLDANAVRRIARETVLEFITFILNADSAANGAEDSGGDAITIGDLRLAKERITAQMTMENTP